MAEHGSKRKMNPEHVRLCNLRDLDEVDSLGLDPLGLGRDTHFVVRRNTLIRVYRNRCPHQGATLPWRKDAFLSADGTRIVCHAHGAQFDIETGICLQGAALGNALQCAEARIDSDGTISARADAIRLAPAS
jgi:nitrite reductase/ring-hydroxylating ferredoxin subunit